MPRPLRVLLVEDSPDDADLILYHLGDAGYTVTHQRVETAAALREALAQQAWEVVLSDHFMPDFSALEALAVLKASGQDLPFIIVTGEMTEEHALSAMRAGAHDYIRKENLARLEPAIERERREAEMRTARREAEAAQRGSEAKYRDLFENAPVSLWEQDFSAVRERLEALRAAGVTDFAAYFQRQPAVVAECLRLVRVIDVNRETLNLYEAPDKAALSNLSQIIPLEDNPLFTEELIRLAAGQTLFELEGLNQTFSGETIMVALRWSAAPGFETTLRKVLVSITNQTARRQMQTQLFNAQKLVDLGTLAAGVAHELNSPLQVITGLSESLLNRLRQGELNAERMAQNLETINRSGWRCAEIVRSLLTYARASTGQRQPQDLNLLVRDTLLLIEHQLRSWANITVTTELAENLPPLNCDRNQITQILINLLTNARDAMPEGGEIILRTGAEAETEHLTLQISDNGAGIPAPLQAKIFEPFFTTKPTGKGTGLGLYIVTGIVRAYGGSLTLESRPGEGTTFTLRFPIDSGADESPANP